MFSPIVLNTESLTAELRIKINGINLAHSDMEAVLDLLSVTVTEDVDAPGMFAIRLMNLNPVTGQITWSDHELFQVGNEVEIYMGNGKQTATLMVGEITGLEFEIDRQEAPTLVVRGYDLRHRLMRGHKTRSFAKIKDSEIASQIARDAGLTATVEDSKIKLEYVLQHNQTDLDFLQSRARRIGYEVAIVEKKLFFQPPRNGASKTLTLTYGIDILAFSARLSNMNQMSMVEVRSWDIKSKEVITAKSSSGNVQSNMGGRENGPRSFQKAFGQASQVIVNDPVSNTSEAKQLASGQLETLALQYVTGSGECQGNPMLRAGDVIEIAGVGKRFSGLYYVTSATHTHSASDGYQTEFEVRRNAT